MHFQITVRYGGGAQRYHTYGVDAPNARDALAEAARRMPEETVESADLVELRVAVDPDARRFLGEDG
ncbi:MAG TPA: hypothetical protein VK849_03220 [Longimicrobiales bacterium]|nr:hypothetical protein [Longimicrobiales bacterium]